jgi:hypothetical protein
MTTLLTSVLQQLLHCHVHIHRCMKMIRAPSLSNRHLLWFWFSGFQLTCHHIEYWYYTNNMDIFCTPISTVTLCFLCRQISCCIVTYYFFFFGWMQLFFLVYVCWSCLGPCGVCSIIWPGLHSGKFFSDSQLSRLKHFLGFTFWFWW